MTFITNQGEEIDPLKVVTGGDLMGLVDDLPTLEQLQQQQAQQRDEQINRVYPGVWAVIEGEAVYFYDWLDRFGPESWTD